MKNMFLLMVVPVLLVTLGFGQAPAPSSNTDQASIKGCLGGSEGSYTVAQDGTTQTFKITNSTVDLKPHLGHDVEITGQKVIAGSSDNNVTVTGVNMISEHCTAATASTLVADPTTATVSTPVVADSKTTATISTPAVVTPAPTATTSTPAEPATTPVMASATERESKQHMPDTATSLPLLGLLGLGLLGTGLLIKKAWAH
jgi:hypothetical protein